MAGVLTLVCGYAAHGARAALVWEPIGPIPTSVGMTSVATDPDDPLVLWVGSATSMWVSDDGGDTFSLVLQLSRVTGIERETGEGDTVEAEDGEEPAIGQPVDPEDVDPSDIEYTDELDPDTGLPIPVEADPLDVEVDTADIDADVATLVGVGSADADAGFEDDPGARFGITRIRVLGDTVYACTGRGLWAVPRAARAAGAGQEVRFGRRVAVNDVYRDADHALLIATEAGLLELGAAEIGRSVTGVDDGSAVEALARVGGVVVAAVDDGLRVEGEFGFGPLGVLSSRSAVTDLVTLDETRLLIVATQGEVLIAEFPSGEAPVLTERWIVPGVVRAAKGRDGSLWAVGGSGPWRYSAGDGWERRDVGLIDRRLRDVAPAASGPAHLYIAGRVGLARLVSEQDRVLSQRARAQAERAVAGMPTAAQVVQWAIASHPIRMSEAERWTTEQRLAWLAPEIELRYRSARQRREELLLVPSLGRRIIDEVTVTPVDDEFIVQARWDLMPAMLAALGSDGTMEATRVAARAGQERVRNAVLPLYHAWVRRRVEFVTSRPTDARAAVRELLALAQLEADLHVYTGGQFPIAGPSGDDATTEQ